MAGDTPSPRRRLCRLAAAAPVGLAAVARGRRLINESLGLLLPQGRAVGVHVIAAVQPATIRAWRRKLLAGGTPEPQAVKAYALLRAIFSTAVKEDEIIRQNPCRIPGYDRCHTPERPTATVAQVSALADAMPPRFSALIVVAALSGLRCGELAALRRQDVDLAAGLVRVPRKLAVLNGRVEFGPPKSDAGVRVVALPAAAVEALGTHLAAFVDDFPDALIFTGEKGGVLRSSSSAVRSAGGQPSPGSVSRSSTSTISGTPGTPSPRPRVRAPGS